jgi:2-oxoglutarate dehydrogenase E1 component
MSLDESLFASMANAQLADEMYETYCHNPQSVDAKWRLFFEQFDSVSEDALIHMSETTTQETTVKVTEAPKKTIPDENKVSLEAPKKEEPAKPQRHSQNKEDYYQDVSSGDLRIYHLIHAYRTYGHLLSKNNPIATREPDPVPELDLGALGFKNEELDQYFPSCGLLKKEHAPLRDIITTLEEIYCGSIGIEYMALGNREVEEWLQKNIEPSKFKFELTIEEKQMILQQLNKSELFENFLNTKYVGQKRFSLEGGETLIPMLMEIIEAGANIGAEEFIIGMAHRGRLNVLCNILDKSYQDIFSEFEGSYVEGSFEGSGDVKYHKGYSSEHTTSKGHKVQVSVADNPSHLEAVGSVVAGAARARQVVIGDDVEMRKIVPIIIHGDASIAGQGIVYECMQFYNLPGYATGGSIHLVINNQIGFTTLPKDSRSTKYCTDISKAFGAPVFHVNAEDPEGCIYATALAMKLRQEFNCDVFLSLNCYRKYGHNEGDEPAFTQPLEYQIIRKKKPIREIFRDKLIQKGVLEKYMAEVLEEEFKTSLQNSLKGTKGFQTEEVKKIGKQEEKSQPIINIFERVKTAVPLKTMQKLAVRFCTIPKDFNAHKKIQRLMKQRVEMVNMDPEHKAIDWGMGEHLAFATLLKEGIHVRLSGQDSRRGTFSHRHAMWMDQKIEKKFFPLNHLMKKQGRFDVFNSPLSEYGVLGFEFGYSLTYPNSESIVLWEAQFGDFSNGAQIIIDQFIATGEQKWGSSSNLVLLLPHGYEGQGPEHSSARIERFLQLCGNDNMFVVSPTTPSQFFHLLRRQVIRNLHKPLIVFTPKGLLRHPSCVSSLAEFAKNTFEEVLDDPEQTTRVEKLLFCSGRLYYDIIEERERREIKNVAVVRIEQLYPLNTDAIQAIIEKYKGFTECLWVQEEPKNMGAWYFMFSQLQDLLPNNITIRYVGRPRSSSPAVGSFGLHKKQHVVIMNDVFSKGEQKLYEMAPMGA